MAIHFSCPCGTKLTAKVELAGRRMRCPACGYEQTIPVTSQATTPPSAPPPRRATPPSPPYSPPTRPAMFSPTFQVSSVSQPVAHPVVAAAAPEPRRVVNESPRAVANDTVQETIPTPEPAQTVVVPLARPVAHPWVDRSLEQDITPWRDEDTRRRGTKSAPRVDWFSVMVVLGGVLLLGGMVALWNWRP